MKKLSKTEAKLKKECMVIIYGKLIPEESLNAEIKKTIQENASDIIM